MAKFERVSVELPFILKLSNRQYNIPIDGHQLCFYVLNGCRKLIRWKTKDHGKEVKVVNIAADDNEVGEWVRKIRSLGHHEDISVVRANTIVSVVETIEETISVNDWQQRKFNEGKLEAIIEGLNRLIDAYRWAGTRTQSGIDPEEMLKVAKVHRVGLAHFLEFIVELFGDSPAPNNYLWQLSIFWELDEDEKGASVSSLGPQFDEAVERSASRQIHEAARLRLDSLSSLLMHNPLQAAFLCWAWVDVELNRAYENIKGVAPPGRESFHSKVHVVLGKKLEAIATEDAEDTREQTELAHRNRRNPMVHGTFTPKDDEAWNDFWLCSRFVKLLRRK